MDNLRLYCVTYNVGTSYPDIHFGDLFSLTSNGKNEKALPDFYVVSLQEVKARPTNILMDALFEDPWTNMCRAYLEEHDYVKLKTIRLQGLVLSIFSLRKHLLNVGEVESEYTRTGLSGMWGNKGAVSIRLNTYGCSICVVNAHLTAHDEGLEDRVKDYNYIVEDHKFHVPEHTQIFYHDYVFWMGDLNFRLLEEYDKNPEEIERSIKKGELSSLFQHDQLRSVMNTGQAFSELTESNPEFPPTFKYEVGSKDEYDHKRRPAWTDRILYKVNSNNYENITLKAEQKSYKAHGDYSLSDHKPVTAEFVIKIPEVTLLDSTKARMAAQVFADTAEHTVQFEKVPIWYQDEENTVVYKITREIPKYKDDWIGVFRDKFGSLDDYILYEYVNKSASPLPVPKSPQHRGGSEVLHNKKYTLTFPELPLSGSSPPIRLIYFSLSEDNVQTVLGISEPIALVKKQDD